MHLECDSELRTESSFPASASDAAGFYASKKGGRSGDLNFGTHPVKRNDLKSRGKNTRGSNVSSFPHSDKRLLMDLVVFRDRLNVVSMTFLDSACSSRQSLPALKMMMMMMMMTYDFVPIKCFDLVDRFAF